MRAEEEEREKDRDRETERSCNSEAEQIQMQCSIRSSRQANAGQSHKLNAFSMCLATDYGAGGTGGGGSVDTLF